jgi:hypothetical protein
MVATAVAGASALGIVSNGGVLGIAAAQPAPAPLPPASAVPAPSTSAPPSAPASAATPLTAAPPVATAPVFPPAAPLPPPSAGSWSSVPIHGYGSRPSSRDGVSVRNAGIGLFVTMYGLTVIGSGVAYGTGAANEAPGDPICTESTPWGFLPLVGPFILAGSYPDYQKLDRAGGTAGCADYTAAVTAVSVIDGLVQITGAALLIAGLAMGGPATDDDASIGVEVRTMSVPGGAGLAIDGSF